MKAGKSNSALSVTSRPPRLVLRKQLQQKELLWQSVICWNTIHQGFYAVAPLGYKRCCMLQIWFCFAGKFCLMSKFILQRSLLSGWHEDTIICINSEPQPHIFIRYSYNISLNMSSCEEIENRLNLFQKGRASVYKCAIIIPLHYRTIRLHLCIVEGGLWKQKINNLSDHF